MFVLRISVLLGLVLAAVGCGSPSEGGPAAAGAGGLPVGRAFHAVAASQGGRDRPLVAKATIEFMADGRTLVATGCNSGQARGSLRGGRLVTDGFAITQMACADPAVADQETFVLSVVDADPTVVLDGNHLVLRTDTAEIRFLDRKAADPDRPLEGTAWRVDGVFDAELASSIAAPKGELVLSGGRVRFSGPCADVEGPAQVDGTTVTFGPLDTGAGRPCDQDQQHTQADVVRVLSGAVRATVKAGNLRLEHPSGRGVSLVAAR